MADSDHAPRRQYFEALTKSAKARLTALLATLVATTSERDNALTDRHEIQVLMNNLQVELKTRTDIMSQAIDVLHALIEKLTDLKNQHDQRIKNLEDKRSQIYYHGRRFMNDSTHSESFTHNAVDDHNSKARRRYSQMLQTKCDVAYVNIAVDIVTCDKEFQREHDELSQLVNDAENTLSNATLAVDACQTEVDSLQTTLGEFTTTVANFDTKLQQLVRDIKEG